MAVQLEPGTVLQRAELAEHFGISQTPIRDALIQRLKFHLGVQETTLKPLDVPRLASADQAFHKEMYDAAQVSSLWSLLRKRSGHVDRLRHLNLPAKGKAQAILQDHRNMVEALEKKDAFAAETALRQHLAGTLSFVKDMKKRFPDWVA